MYVTLGFEAKIDAPGRRVWALLNDFERTHEFNPFVTISPVRTGDDGGLGAEREVLLYDGSVKHEYVLDVEKDRSILIAVSERNALIKAATARLTVEPPDQNISFLKIELTYEPRFGFLGKLLGLAYKPVLMSQYNHLIRGLNEYLSAHESVEQHGCDGLT